MPLALSLPLVLAGPILRRTQPDSVTVWIALKEPTMVRLSVYDSSNLQSVLLEGEEHTIQFGPHLHIVAVSADAGRGLNWGGLYVYDLYSNSLRDSLLTESLLGDAGLPGQDVYNGPATLRYSQFSLPSFSLLPQDLNHTRIVHGSCLKPHNPGENALTWLDGMIHSTASEPLFRPHLLFLTGDQIYADDVSDSLLHELILTGNDLLGWTSNPEELLDSGGDNLQVTNPAELRAGNRERIATNHAGLTSAFIDKSELAKSHLFSFAEFAAMYLFVWSDSVWPAQLPTYAQVFPNGSTRISESAFNTERASTARMRFGLTAVRRALANVPVYMMFDDHEVADDLYLNYNWCTNSIPPGGALHESRSLGTQVIENGMLAYAIFQAWGNTPKQFAAGTPGRQLLEAASRWVDDRSGPNRAAVSSLLGVPSVRDVRINRELLHNQNTIDWNYYIEGPNRNFVAIVLDTRTWRSFHGKGHDASGLISTAGLSKQLQSIPAPAEDGLTIVVSPAPVIQVPSTEKIKRKYSDTYLGTLGYDFEEWAFEPVAYNNLLAKLATRNQTSSGVDFMERLLILSGDIHNSYSASMMYWTHRPFGSTDPVRGKALFVQLTSSALKNESTETMYLHTGGYDPYWFGSPITHTPHWLGWNEPQTVAQVNIGTAKSPSFWNDYEVGNLTRSPALLLMSNLPKDSVIRNPPDWQFRTRFHLALKRADRTGSAVRESYPRPAPDRNGRNNSLRGYLDAGSKPDLWSFGTETGQEVVGINNICEITFRWNPGNDKFVVYECWWRLGNRPDPFPLTRYDISMSLEEQEPNVVTGS